MKTGDFTRRVYQRPGPAAGASQYQMVSSP